MTADALEDKLEDKLEALLVERRDALYETMRADGLTIARACVVLELQREADDAWRRATLETITRSLTAESLGFC